MRRTGIAVILIILAVAGILTFFTYPHTRQVSSSMEGVGYQLGDNHNIVPVKIEVDGELHYSIRKKITFSGTIKINGEGLEDPYYDRKLHMRFYKSGDGLMSYLMDFANFVIKEHSYGPADTKMYNDRYHMTFANEDFSKITIEADIPEGGDWDPDSLFLISAPAGNRSEALEIAKETMKGYIKSNNMEPYYIFE